jgi:hypothetical protein
MIVTIIVPTGEVRKPEKYEYAWVEDLKLWQPCGNAWYSNWPIGIAHEVEVPERCESIRIYGAAETTIYGEWLQDIPLPRPKVKVKKAWWLMFHPQFDTPCIHFGTEEVVKTAWPNMVSYYKVEETEIEVSDE